MSVFFCWFSVLLCRVRCGVSALQGAAPSAGSRFLSPSSRLQRSLSLCLLLCLLLCASPADANPFTGGRAKKTNETVLGTQAVLTGPTSNSVGNSAGDRTGSVRGDSVGDAKGEAIGEGTARKKTSGSPFTRRKPAVSNSGVSGGGSADSGTVASGVTVRSNAQGVAREKAGFVALRYTRFLRTINLKQRELRRDMAKIAREIKQNPFGGAFWWFLGLSFMYGVVHALGPGHGKSIVFAYFLGRRGSIWKGFFMGHMLTFIHVLSAVALVLGLHAVAGRASTAAMDATSGLLQQVSYGCIVFIGLIMFGHGLYEVFGARGKGAVPLAETTGSDIAAEAGYGSMGSVSLAAGLIPCPGAALVLSFSLSLGILTAGLFSMVTFALGMGLTTAAFGVASILSRGALMHVAGRGPRVVNVLYTFFSLAASLGIVVIGVFMLLSLSGS